MQKNIKNLAAQYSENKPFPHIVLNNIWPDKELSRIAHECEKFDDWDQEMNFAGSVGKRACGTISKFPPSVLALVNYCNSSKFLKQLEDLTGEVGLIPDPYLLGGGIHSTVNQGFLKMHADFNWHKHLKLYRRLNLLIYLNKDWDESWGGALKLGLLRESGVEVSKSIMPDFNKTVIFTTTNSSYHGHPEPMNLPKGKARNSLALYYYLSSNPLEASEAKRIKTVYCKNAWELIEEKLADEEI